MAWMDKTQRSSLELLRREIRHEPESTACRCGCQMKRIGEEIAEKLDYQPNLVSLAWSDMCAANGHAGYARPLCNRR
jgi:hypothetical protein